MIKAIETEHNGWLFRSRLEARFAIFLEKFGVSYYYEREGYENTGKSNKFRYLPDFFIPQWDTFIEIKGDPGELTESNLTEWIYVGESLNKKFLVIFKDIWPCHWTLFIPPNPKDYVDILDNNRFFYGPAQFCTDNKGSRFLMMLVSGYEPSLREAIVEYMNEFISKNGTKNIQTLLEMDDSELDKIFSHCVFKDLARVCFFPLDNEPHYPLAIYKKLKFGEFVLDNQGENILGISYRADLRKQICLGNFGNPILKSANGIRMMNLKFNVATDAYIAARQARFEHGQNGH